MNLFRTKPSLPRAANDSHLHRCLSAFDLTLFGIGAIIGAGVFVLTGVAAATKAGPGITVSYVIAGLASLFAALSYAELAASIGGAGSAYNYSYVSFGELIAWIIGWDLLLEYAMSVSTVAIGWSGYVNNALQAMNIHVPDMLLKGPLEGGIINLFAFAIIIALAALLCFGVKHSARFNAAIVFIKLLTIVCFCAVAIDHVHFENWHPYLPFGWSGVMGGAALVFFAYIGFDAVSTAAEETINPERDLPIGIIFSVIICTVIYIFVAALLTGIVPYTTLNVRSPVAEALLNIGHPIAAGLVAAGAIAGLTTVMLVMYYGLTRICFAIARDGLLPAVFARIHHRTRTPVFIIIFTGTIIALIAGLVPIGEAAELVNIGTLFAFVLVCGGTLYLRWTQPKMRRPFKLPLSPVVPLLGIIFCLYLMFSLPLITWIRFIAWFSVGILIYIFYGYTHSLLNRND